MDASLTPHETLADVLAARARRTPKDRLVIDAVGGLLVSIAALWARPVAWFPLAVAASCLANYGLWAIAERRLYAADGSEITGASPVWHVLRHLAGGLGLAGFVILLFALLGIALGPIQS